MCVLDGFGISEETSTYNINCLSQRKKEMPFSEAKTKEKVISNLLFWPYHFTVWT